MILVDVAIPLRLPRLLTYQLPPQLKAAPGNRVVVPLGRREVVGCLVAHTSGKAPGGLKQVISLLEEEPLLSPALVRMLQWASQYYLTPIGEVLRHLIPAPLFSRKGNSTSSKGRAIKSFPNHEEFSSPPPVQLNAAQEEVLRKIDLKSSHSYLIEGVTGSGKTEVYIRLAQEVVKQGGQVLVLVPEITLTPQLVGRFRGGLPCPIFPYHSGLTEAQRLHLWQQVRAGSISVIIGTRSALFLPFRRLQLILVDEEQDSSFKQEERFCYHARDLALWRGKEEKIPVLLGSATPSLESLHRCRRGKMIHLKLPDRPEGVVLPEIRLIDRRHSLPKGELLTDPLKEEIAKSLKKREQVLIFLNRRGYSSFLICLSCGWIPRCPHCDISLTHHKKESKLLCHYCDQSVVFSLICGVCHEPSLRPSGVGTEKIEEELRKLFPAARIARLDRDSGKSFDTLAQMKKREIDILIGTQMVGKGHDYPHLTQVGILDADTSLNLPDFRSAERTFQLVTQVAGRAGRGKIPGRVLIQTFHPENPALIAAAKHQLQSFAEAELKHREEWGYPPFTRLVRLLLSGQKPKLVERAAQVLSDRIREKFVQRDPSLLTQLLGPAPCPLPKIRNKYRWHLLLKSRNYAQLQGFLQPLLDDFSADGLPSGVRILVNVDPGEMM